MLGSHGRTPVGDRLEHGPIGFVASVLALDFEVEEGLGAERSLVPELGDNYRTSWGTIEAFEHHIVVFLIGDLRDKLCDGRGGCCVHLEQLGDAVRVQQITAPVGVLVEERGRFGGVLVIGNP